MFTTETLVRWSGGKLENVVSHQFDGFSFDSRDEMAGRFFVPLKGDRFDAHDFLIDVLNKGAQGCFVSQSFKEDLSSFKDRSIIRVDDTLRALQETAHAYRQTFKGKVVGLTGSNGKTTVKDFCRQLISPFKKVHVPQGSFNNHWGVPMTLLAVPQETQVTVIEMGMNHLGEIERLTQMAAPDIAGVVMIGRSHIGELGSQEAIVKAKDEIHWASAKSTQILFNLDNPFTAELAKNHQSRFTHTLSASSKDSQADIYLSWSQYGDFPPTVSGSVLGVKGECSFPVLGRHQITNLMMAVGFAVASGVTPEQIWQTIPKLETGWGRMMWVDSLPFPLLFDGYNANPDSMQALIDEVKGLPYDCHLILGEMKELGSEAEKSHYELGASLKEVAPKSICYVGDFLSEFEDGVISWGGNLLYKASNVQVLSKEWLNSLGKKDLVVAKASRGVALEEAFSVFGFNKPK